MNSERTTVTVETSVHAPISKVWSCWTEPIHITQWNAASDDWHTPRAENDLRTGGVFTSRMEARDGSSGFDFSGTYTEVIPHQHIAYTLGGDDGRKVDILFQTEGENVKITETFDAENINSIDRQKAGWQAILDRFKQYVEKT
jgi:uncharacterized protein YndB with AHSA1/START domain